MGDLVYDSDGVQGGDVKLATLQENSTAKPSTLALSDFLFVA
jgi:hypothetical protein